MRRLRVILAGREIISRMRSQNMKEPEDKEERERRRELPRLKADIALRNVLGTADGRYALRWLLSEVCAAEQPSFNTNALTMAFNEGRRSVAIVLSARLKAVSSDMYQLMQEESNE